jgi:hypothetical protein
VVQLECKVSALSVLLGNTKPFSEVIVANLLFFHQKEVGVLIASVPGEHLFNFEIFAFLVYVE